MHALKKNKYLFHLYIMYIDASNNALFTFMFVCTWREESTLPAGVIPSHSNLTSIHYLMHILNLRENPE